MGQRYSELYSLVKECSDTANNAKFASIYGNFVSSMELVSKTSYPGISPAKLKNSLPCTENSFSSLG